VTLFGTCRVFGGDLSFPQYDWLFNFHAALIAKTTFRAIPWKGFGLIVRSSKHRARVVFLSETASTAPHFTAQVCQTSPSDQANNSKIFELDIGLQLRIGNLMGLFSALLNWSRRAGINITRPSWLAWVLAPLIKTALGGWV
jgi:hypothetical protein